MGKSLTLAAGTTNVFPVNRTGKLIKATLISGTGAASTAKIYDADSGTTTQLASLAAVTGNMKDEFFPGTSIDFVVNLRVVVSGSGAECIVEFD